MFDARKCLCVLVAGACIRQSSFWPRRTDNFIPWPTLTRRTAREKPLLIYSDCKRCHFIIYMTSIPDVLFMSWLNRYAAIRRVTHMQCNRTEMEIHRSQSYAPLNCTFTEQQRTMSYEKSDFQMNSCHINTSAAESPAWCAHELYKFWCVQVFVSRSLPIENRSQFIMSWQAVIRRRHHPAAYGRKNDRENERVCWCSDDLGVCV